MPEKHDSAQKGGDGPIVGVVWVLEARDVDWFEASPSVLHTRDVLVGARFEQKANDVHFSLV